MEWKNENLVHCDDGVIVNGFIEFISILRISTNQTENFAQFAPKLKSIKELELDLFGRIDNIHGILPRCEKIAIFNHCLAFPGNLYDDVLKFSTNLKHLKVSAEFHRGSESNWLLYEYPKLESVDLTCVDRITITRKQINNFLALNTGVRKFGIGAKCLVKYKLSIFELLLPKLTEFSVGCLSFLLSLGSPEELIELLNTLYDRGFYERLSIVDPKNFSEFSNKLEQIKAPFTLVPPTYHF